MSTDRRVAVAVLGIVSVVATLAVLLGDQFVRTLGLIALVSGAALACALAWRAVRSSAAPRRRRWARRCRRPSSCVPSGPGTEP